MQVLGDIIYNPNPRDLMVMIAGTEHVFPKFKAVELLFSNDPSTQDGAVARIRGELGKMGVEILDKDELKGGPLWESLTEEEVKLYRANYIAKVMWAGRNRFYAHMYRQFFIHPEEDNRKLQMAGKGTLGVSPYTQMWRETLEVMKRSLDGQQRNDTVSDVRATKAAAENMPGPDLRGLPINKLREYAKQKGLEKTGQMGRVAILDLLGMGVSEDDLTMASTAGAGVPEHAKGNKDTIEP